MTLLSRNVPIRVSQTGEEWTEVVKPVRGWAKTSDVQRKASAPAKDEFEWQQRRTSCEVALRDGPYTSAESLAVVPCGAEIECAADSGKNWVIARASV